MYSERLRAFVVDEAHTVKKWYFLPNRQIDYPVLVVLFRGESFRVVMERLGEVRSLIPQRVNIMALTATATKTVCLKVSSTLGMVRPVVIARKKKLLYSIGTFTTVSETFKPLLDRLRKDRE